MNSADKYKAVKAEITAIYHENKGRYGYRRITTELHMVTLSLKRDRKIINKAELTRLQRNLEACVAEISHLERSRQSAATMWALIVGVIGTAFMAGSVFAVTHEPPIIWLCILLAIPAFIGWITPYFLYRSIEARHTAKIQPMIEAKQEEIYELCEKGHNLL